MKAELIIDAPIIDQKKIWIKKVRKPHFDHPFHYHQLCELTWLEKGHGKLIVGDYIGNFHEGELILKNAGLPHLWRCDTDFYGKTGAQTKAIAVYFPPSFIPSITDETKYASLYNDILIRSDRGLRFYGLTKSNIIQLIKKMASGEGFEQLGYFLQIIQLMIRTKEFQLLASGNYKNTYNSQDMERFNKVYQFLLENFKRDIKLDDVATLCHMTPNSFCRYFKTKTQKTYTRFLNELRIGHACKLLQDRNNAVLNICYECGYNSPVNFFKFFKLITHKTPMEYRRDVRTIASDSCRDL